MYTTTMKTTSHFVGMSLDSSRFVDLFVELQQYFKSYDLEKAVEFQNILSTHITLFYLESFVNKEEKARILQDIADLSSKEMPAITQLHRAYFGEPDKERVCYLGCPQNVRLEQINNFFAKKYNYSQVPENQLAFIAHISIFRINDPEAYVPHKADIDMLVDKAVEAIDYNGLVKDLQLFQVNSLFHPEIQIPIQSY